MYVFCLSCPSATFALQHGGFVPREWLSAKGLLLIFCRAPSSLRYTLAPQQTIFTRKSAFQRRGINSTFLVFNLECNLTHERLVISCAADYASFHEMYDALVVKKEVEGILADIYTASYYMEKVGDSRLAVTMFFTSQRSIGFAVGRQDFKSHSACLRDLFKYRQRDIKKIILRHTQALHVSHV